MLGGVCESGSGITNQATIDCAVAEQFGSLMVRGDVSGACSLLAQEARLLNPPVAIQAAVEDMIADGSDPIRESQVIDEAIVVDSPGRQPDDSAVVHNVLSGDSFTEAVTLSLLQEDRQVRISQLAWEGHDAVLMSSSG